MIDATYVRAMARYNRWQNDNLYSVADSLSDEARRKDRGAFFKSIHATLNHLLWADNMWMSRLSELAGAARQDRGLDDLRRRLGGVEKRSRHLRRAYSRLGASAGR